MIVRAVVMCSCLLSVASDWYCTLSGCLEATKTTSWCWNSGEESVAFSFRAVAAWCPPEDSEQQGFCHSRSQTQSQVGMYRRPSARCLSWERMPGTRLSFPQVATCKAVVDSLPLSYLSGSAPSVTLHFFTTAARKATRLPICTNVASRAVDPPGTPSSVVSLL